MIAGSIKFMIVLDHATDPEVAVGDIIDVMEEVMDMTDDFDAAEEAVDEDELLVLVGFALAASGEADAKAAQAVVFLALEPTKDPMFATTA